ncbi:MAG: hypothetical protein IKP02_03230 [Paludibacteraceae bacterium]|nr:hypothetical protein [Paludibacteraceae bacterium]
MMIRYRLLYGLVLLCTLCVSAEPLKVVSYNVENLFHPAHDTVAGIGKDDWEWTPEGERRWSFNRYERKVENIARVLTHIGEWQGVDIAGLQEIENAACVSKLCNTLRRGEYAFVHYESPDRRGIDVALIYKKSRIDTLATRAIRVSGLEVSGLEELITRDILYVCARIDKRDTIHFFVCHMPSQRGGKAESEWKREAAQKVLQRAVDSVYTDNPEAKIVVMGDMNDDGLRMRGLVDERMRGNGTHKYQGRWTFLDHFYVSPALDSLSHANVYDAEWIMETDEKQMGLRPKRTYNGFHYQNGFSDHLPIVLMIDD